MKQLWQGQQKNQKVDCNNGDNYLMCSRKQEFRIRIPVTAITFQRPDFNPRRKSVMDCMRQGYLTLYQGKGRNMIENDRIYQSSVDVFVFRNKQKPF